MSVEKPDAPLCRARAGLLRECRRHQNRAAPVRHNPLPRALRLWTVTGIAAAGIVAGRG
jgi:hypothetical protein